MKRFFGVLFFVFLLLTLSGAPAPVVAQSSSEYFSVTGHFVRGDFLIYYRSVPNAELVFGYPITEAFPKNGRLIQYFQRALFELYPELPAGQRVRLVPLGQKLYKPGERLNIFNPFACRYFPQTGFSVCYAFLDFYKNNGGVERFGQPISSFEFHNDLIVQYFEYARFEWKPWLPEGQRVALADLGRLYFDDQKEDPNRLTAVPFENEKIMPVRIQVRAFVWKAVTLASDHQLIFVIAQDQNLQPIAGAQGMATVRWADGTSGVFSFVTNGSGVGIVPLTFTNQPYGKMIYIDILVAKDGLSASTTTSFRIWY